MPVGGWVQEGKQLSGLVGVEERRPFSRISHPGRVVSSPSFGLCSIGVMKISKFSIGIDQI